MTDVAGHSPTCRPMCTYPLILPSITVIVGGSGDIGSAIATVFQDCGSETYILDLQPPHPDCHSTFLHCDVTNEESVAAALEEIGRSTDSRTSAAIVYVSGVSGSVALTEMQIAEWKRVMGVNSTGAFLVAKHGIPWLTAHRWSRLILISSMSSLVADRGRHNAHYCASKAAINGLTQHLAATYAMQGLTVNAVLPGYVKTSMVANVFSETQLAELDKMIPIGRMAETSEIATSVLFLAAKQSSYVTGALMVVDGGFSRW